ncbi:MAG: hypothetical protein LBM73_00520 [Candidatus Nomurabacteria bacterium]|nr:hypothetical protein [Candidatus Nomurabacteria bacterium]
MFKNYVRKKLEKLVKKYFARHHPKLIVVVGAAGKTTTKTAIATVLSTKWRVQMENGNHNTALSVPPAILGVKYPDNVKSVVEWRRVFKAMKIRIKQPTGVDAIVQELGTSAPGEIPHFGTYLKPDIAVITSVLPEHMEFFKDLDAVAKEELNVASWSNLTIVNRDDIDAKFAGYADTHNIDTYGLLEPAEYRFEIDDGSPLDGYQGKFISPDFGAVASAVNLVGEQNVKAAVAAGAVAAKLGMTADEIALALPEIRPVSGRMNILQGFRDTTILDDTYNALPDAVAAALRTLYQIQTPQRIAILGGMNELGQSKSFEHTRIGQLCDPKLLDWVITIGEDAARYIAPAAKHRGNNVASFKSPYDAGAFCNRVMRPGAVILVKGSQNGVFAEEAVKVLLRRIEDEDQLVRQSDNWKKIKDAQFEKNFVTDLAAPVKDDVAKAAEPAAAKNNHTK